MALLSPMPIFGSLARIKMCGEQLVCKVLLSGCQCFMTGYLEHGVIVDIMDHHNM